MMTKQQHIDYWINTAEKDWASVDILFEGKQYLQSLFWAHLVLEKLAKAHWVKSNEENIPPKTHNLIVLLTQACVDLGEEKMNFLVNYNNFQLSARYPDYLNEIYKVCTEQFSEKQLDNVKEIRQCLLKMLP
ncbi:MAG: HEPN domain-containing protein [Candidatus Azobacteroides sp.]|nr:HEPN domain-containing protein [Candidatus Azobacteroides sp.]